MKILLLIVGALLVAFSIYSLVPLIKNFSLLSEYGKGAAIGNGVLMVLGFVMIVYWRKLSKSN